MGNSLVASVSLAARLSDAFMTNIAKESFHQESTFPKNA
jgi:predicted PhzF superfamily epimerase YddE/YHI9